MTNQPNHKKDLHIQACLDQRVESSLTNGFEHIKLSGGWPDFSFYEMDLKCRFLGKTLELPLMVSPLTGKAMAAEVSGDGPRKPVTAATLGDRLGKVDKKETGRP